MVFAFIIAVVLIAAFIYLANEKPALPFTYLPIDDRSFKTPANWKGTPVDRKGRFVNEEYPFYQNYYDIIFRFLPSHAWNLWKNRLVKFPITTHDNDKFLRDNDSIIWLGHASFLMRLAGYNLLVDPHFNNTAVYKRHTNNPIDPQLFRNIDFILISHDHADHLDVRSIRILVKNNPDVVILTGLKMDETITAITRRPVICKTVNWYEQFSVNDDLQISFVPSRHYCKRIWRKFNESLWGGFVISYNADQKRQSIYFAGDSGYGSHFKTINELFKPDLAIIGIGAFMPEAFMEPNHMAPEQALVAFDDTGAAAMIPMHFGTFNLGNEHMHEPLTRLMNKAGSRRVLPLQVGEVFYMQSL